MAGNNNYYDTDRCKRCREVNIAFYFRDHEMFIPDVKKSNKSWLNSNGPNGEYGSVVFNDTTTGDKYLVKRNPKATTEYQFYLLNGNLPGHSRQRYFSLIDYMIAKKNLSFGDALSEIERIAGMPSQAISNVSNASREMTTAVQAPANRLPKEELTDLTNTEYLQGRGISVETLNDPIFKGRIFNRPTHFFWNTIYPMWDCSGNLITWCEKNKQGNQTYEHFPKGISTEHCLHYSHPPANPDFIVFSEAPINNLSYYQMHPALKGRCFMLSSNGTLRQTHLPILQHFVDIYQPKAFLLLNDKDTAGYRYDLMILGAIRPPGGTGSPIQANISLKKTPANLTINKAEITFSADYEHRSLLQQLAQVLGKVAGQGIFHFEQTAVGEDLQKKSFFNLQSPEEYSHIIKVCNMLTELNNHNQFFFIDKPSGSNLSGIRLKDWNDVIQDNEVRKSQEKAPQYSTKLSDFLETIRYTSSLQTESEGKKKAMNHPLSF